jgi:hypothetical protein
MVTFMKKTLILVMFLTNVFVARADEVDDLIGPLKKVLQLKARYDKRKEAVIDSYKNQLEKCLPGDYTKRYGICKSLYLEYKVYKFDSAYVYARKLVNLASQSGSVYQKNESQIKLAAVLESTGLYMETNDLLKKIDANDLVKPLKLAYYELLFHFELNRAKYNRDTYYEGDHLRQAQKYLDSTILYSIPGSFNYHIHLAEKPSISEPMASTAHYLYLYNHFPLTIHQRAMVATGLSYDYQDDEKIRWLVIGAINDIKASVKETEAIFLLGKLLASKGKLNDAYAFVQAAMNDAEFFNARLRKVSISGELSMISAKRIVQVEGEKANFIIYLITIVAISIIIFLVAFIIFVQMRRLKSKEIVINDQNTTLKQINEKLYIDSRIKEEYIGNFFKVFSGYIIKIEKLKIALERKVRTGKNEEALKIINTIDIKKEREELFKTFDVTFLRLFPNFVSVFNSLLREEDRVHLKEKELLNPHMRIFALMRLGIINNKVVADILEYSESTVYTYKNRIKNKALIPDFNDAIMNIQIGL